VPIRLLARLAFATALLALAASRIEAADQPWVVYEGGTGPGAGKHVVLLSGDEEYRAEEALPQLAKILSKRHGFKCTVLFAIGEDGGIDPNRSFIPGLEALDTADLMVIFTRFRDLPDDQMKHVVDYLDRGGPIVGLRTATHAFNIKKGKTYDKYSFNSNARGWDGGFGRQVLGETWISHHGQHGKQSTRGIIARGEEKNPILKGIKNGDVWGPTDVYGVRLPLPGDSKPIVMGEVLTGMNSTDPALSGEKNDPMMPVAWTRSYKSESGKSGRVFCTTMGASQDLLSEGTRRMLVNACYWAIGLEDKIPEKSAVALVGDYEPSPFKFGGFKKGVKPSDHAAK
jgi:type 1 glutamine amidotransferase